MCCFHKRVFFWCGPPIGPKVWESMLESCGKTLAGDADIFFRDDNTASEKYLAYLRKLLLAKGQYCNADPRSLDPCDFLSPNCRKIFKRYQDAFTASTDNCTAFVADILQDPKQRNISGRIMPSLTCKSARYSFTKGRFFTTEELWGAHGWPIDNMPFDIDNLAPPVSQKLVGNGIHLPAIAYWVTWCLAHVHMKDTVNASLLTAYRVLDDKNMEADDLDNDRNARQSTDTAGNKTVDIATKPAAKQNNLAGILPADTPDKNPVPIRIIPSLSQVTTIDSDSSGEIKDAQTFPYPA